MNNKRILEYAAIFTVSSVFVAAALAYAFDGRPPQFPTPFARAYAGQIDATGTLDLRNYTGDDLFSLDINTDFTSLVPNIIVAGEYDGEFHGFATAREYNIRLNGMMIVNNINFWVAFTIDRPGDVSVGCYSTNGPLHLNISEYVFPPRNITMASMKGHVTKFGDDYAFGFLEANIKTGTQNFTKVNARFTLQPPPRNEDATERPRNFTVSFYMVTLTNATKTEMNYDGQALFVEGYWSVYNKTLTVTHCDHEETTVVEVQTLLENSSGTFEVTLTPTRSFVLREEERRWETKGNFRLDIPDLNDMITGEVIFYQIRFADQDDRFIPRCDFNQDHVVNMIDLSRVARAFLARYGDPRYETDLDIDGKLVINMIDIAATAAEFGQEY